MRKQVVLAYLECTVAVQGAHSHGTLPVDGSILVVAHKAVNQQTVRLLRGCQVGGLFNETHVHALEQSVREHGRRAALNVVALLVGISFAHYWGRKSVITRRW